MKKVLPCSTVSHTRVQKSYYIRVARAGGPLGETTLLVPCWAMDDDLPAAWENTCADPTVLDAQVFRSSQRRKPHQKRKIAASYTKQTIVAA